MSITVLSYPQPVALVKNPILFKLHTDNYITTAATTSQMLLFWSSLPSNGDQFTLAWGNNSVTFTFVTGTPDGTGTQIQIPGAFTYPAFSNNIIAGINKNYIVQNDFLCTAYSGAGPVYGVDLHAYKAGTGYNIVVTEALANFSSTALGVALNEVKRSNFEILFQVSVKLNGEDFFRQIIELAQTPDINGDCYFDIADILQPYFSAVPQLAIESVHKDEGTGIIPYQVHYAELYGDTPVVYETLTYTNTFGILSALNGGVKKSDFIAFSLFTGWLTANKSFLTWDPIEKIISTTQFEQLAFLCTSSFFGLNIKSKIYFADGTTITYNNESDIDPMNAGDLIYIPAGYNDVGAGIADYENPTNKILKYTIQLFDNLNAAKSEVRTYIIDVKSRINERVFLYKNSFGVLATLRTTGEVISTGKNTDSLAQMILPVNYENQDFEIKRINVKSSDTFTVSTGFFPSIEWKNAFRDFLRSSEVYEMAGPSLYLVPVIITSLDDSSKEADSLYSSKFQYQYAYSDDAYSNVNPIL